MYAEIKKIRGLAESPGTLGGRVVSDSSRYGMGPASRSRQPDSRQGHADQPGAEQRRQHVLLRLYSGCISRSGAAFLQRGPGLVMNDYQAELEAKWIQRLPQEVPGSDQQEKCWILLPDKGEQTQTSSLTTSADLGLAQGVVVQYRYAFFFRSRTGEATIPAPPATSSSDLALRISLRARRGQCERSWAARSAVCGSKWVLTPV